MQFILLLNLFLALGFAGLVKAEPAPTFKLHLVSEPQSLDVHQQRSANVGYFQGQLHGTLLKWKNGLVSDLAESCTYVEGTKLKCKLRSNSKFSNGVPIEAKHFLLSFERILSPANLAPRADILFAIKGAKDFYEGKLKDFTGVGVKSPDKYSLEFELNEVDYEFIYNLTSPLLAPFLTDKLPDRSKASEFISSGPFTIAEWKPGVSVKLKPNVHYYKFAKTLPQLEMFFIAEDTTALRLFEAGELDFLRRLPTLYIPKYREKPEFHTINQHRFDYWGFSSSLDKSSDLRRDLTQSLNFEELQKLFSADSPPGCLGLTSSLYNKEICYKYQNQTKKYNHPTMNLYFAKQGGDDHRRSLEWIQNEWLKNLKVRVQLVSVDQKILPEAVKAGKAGIFRKGVSAESPTCFSILSNFTTDSPENLIDFKNTEYDNLVKSLVKTQDELERKKLCQNGLEILMNSHRLIPTGKINFSVLAKTQWTGWNLNELNNLDLSDLKLLK